jgi:hypothetical protein
MTAARRQTQASGQAMLSLSAKEADRSVCSLNHTDLSVKVKHRVMKSLSQGRRPARERLLAAADELFYEEGFNLVGIDREIERAGVAKASLYDCFGSKEPYASPVREWFGIITL